MVNDEWIANLTIQEEKSRSIKRKYSPLLTA